MDGKSKTATFVKRMIQGALIGTGAILPGISGGVLCVAFGIYEPMMELLGNPFRNIGRHFRLFLPVVLGGGIGFVLLAGVIERFLAASPAVALMLFAGLICGTIPAMLKRTAAFSPEKGWSILVCTLFLAFLLFGMLEAERGTAVLQPGFGAYVFCGVVWGLSMVVPGLSSSSLLLFLGLYEPMSAGISRLEFSVLLPLMLGFGVTVLAAGRVVDTLLRRCPVLMQRFILGFVLASTLMILPTAFSGALQFALGLFCFAGGFVLAYRMDAARPED